MMGKKKKKTRDISQKKKIQITGKFLKSRVTLIKDFHHSNNMLSIYLILFNCSHGRIWKWDFNMWQLKTTAILLLELCRKSFMHMNLGTMMLLKRYL